MSFAAPKPKLHAMIFKTTMIMCLLLLFSTCCCAVPLRGSVYPKQSPLRPRMLMKDDETPAPSPSPTERPTATPSATPSMQPSEKPVVQPVQPVFLQTPTVVPSAMPSFAGSTILPPTSVAPAAWPRPPTSVPTASISSIAPSTTPSRTLVALANFGIEFLVAGNTAGTTDESNMTQATEAYLFETMQAQFDTLTSIELVQQQRRRRYLQQQQVSQTIQYSGNAVFDSEPIPSTREVAESQTVALEDTESLQSAYDTAGVDVVVQQVQVQQPESSQTTNSNTGLIVGVSIGAAVVVLALLLGVWWWHKRDYNCKHVVHLEEHAPKNENGDDDSFVKYTPDDFEPSSPKSLPLAESNTLELDQSVEVDMEDEYSLSAASVDSSVHKNPEERRESLLRKLALYQKTEKKPSAAPPEKVPMPAALFVPQVIPRDASELSLSVADSPQLLADTSRAVSLLDQSDGRDDSFEEEEEELLPPPVPVSTGTSSQWALDTSDHQLVPSESPDKQSQWSLSPQQPAQNQYGDYEANMETQLVPAVRFDYCGVFLFHADVDSCNNVYLF